MDLELELGIIISSSVQVVTVWVCFSHLMVNFVITIYSNIHVQKILGQECSGWSCALHIFYIHRSRFIWQTYCVYHGCVWVLCLNAWGLLSCKHRCPALYEALKRSDFPNLLPNCKNKAVKSDGCETRFTMFRMFMNITCINIPHKHVSE